MIIKLFFLQFICSILLCTVNYCATLDSFTNELNKYQQISNNETLAALLDSYTALNKSDAKVADKKLSLSLHESFETLKKKLTSYCVQNIDKMQVFFESSEFKQIIRNLIDWRFNNFVHFQNKNDVKEMFVNGIINEIPEFTDAIKSGQIDKEDFFRSLSTKIENKFDANLRTKIDSIILKNELIKNLKIVANLIKSNMQNC